MVGGRNFFSYSQSEGKEIKFIPILLVFSSKSNLISKSTFTVHGIRCYRRYSAMGQASPNSAMGVYNHTNFSPTLLEKSTFNPSLYKTLALNNNNKWNCHQITRACSSLPQAHRLFKTKGFMITPITLSSVPGMLSESSMGPGLFQHYALISNPGSKFSIQQIYPVASQALRI